MTRQLVVSASLMLRRTRRPVLVRQTTQAFRSLPPLVWRQGLVPRTLQLLLRVRTRTLQPVQRREPVRPVKLPFPSRCVLVLLLVQEQRSQHRSRLMTPSSARMVRVLLTIHRPPSRPREFWLRVRVQRTMLRARLQAPQGPLRALGQPEALRAVFRSSRPQRALQGPLREPLVRSKPMLGWRAVPALHTTPHQAPLRTPMLWQMWRLERVLD